MKLRHLWLESIEQHPPAIQDWLLKETARTRIMNEAPYEELTIELPADYKFLGGPGCFTDLGFENLGLDQEAQFAILRAFNGDGVRIPGSPYCLRHARPGFTYIEAGADISVSLPDHWRECVLVTRGNDLVFVGKRVGSRQIGDNIDLSGFTDLGFGWFRKE